MPSITRNLLKGLGRIFPDCVTLGQAIAFNMFLAFFPLLLLAVGLLSGTSIFQDAMKEIPARLSVILPPGSTEVVTDYFLRRGLHQMRWIYLGLGGTLIAGSQVMMGFIEGFRVIEGDPIPLRFWRRQLRALGLLCLTIVPILAVTALTVFGKPFRARVLDQPGPKRLAKNGERGHSQYRHNRQAQKPQRTQLAPPVAQWNRVSLDHSETFDESHHHLRAGNQRSSKTQVDPAHLVQPAAQKIVGHNLGAAGRQDHAQTGGNLFHSVLKNRSPAQQADGQKQQREKCEEHVERDRLPERHAVGENPPETLQQIPGYAGHGSLVCYWTCASGSRCHSLGPQPKNARIIH